MIEIIVSVVTGVLSLLGVIITVVAGQSKTQQQIKINAAVTEERITELTREVRMHNDFARRIPVLEEKMKVADHRIGDLENNEKAKN